MFVGVESRHFPLGFVSDPPTTAPPLSGGFFALDEMGANLIAVEEMEGATESR